VPDGCDDLIDSDNDGVADADDVCEGHNDTFDGDGDGVPDGCEDPLQINGNASSVEEEQNRNESMPDQRNSASEGSAFSYQALVSVVLAIVLGGVFVARNRS